MPDIVQDVGDKDIKKDQKETWSLSPWFSSDRH